MKKHKSNPETDHYLVYVNSKNGIPYVGLAATNDAIIKALKKNAKRVVVYNTGEGFDFEKGI